MTQYGTGSIKNSQNTVLSTDKNGKAAWRAAGDTHSEDNLDSLTETPNTPPSRPSAENPVLQDLRLYGESGGWTPEDAYDSLTDMDSEALAWECDEAQIRQAEKVLSRLIVLRGGAKPNMLSGEPTPKPGDPEHAATV